MITIIFDDKKTLEITPGLTLAELLDMLPPRKRRPVAAIVNSALQELDYPLYIDSQVEWLDYNCNLGYLIYRRSLIFLLQLAVAELFPNRTLHVSHSLSEGLYCCLTQNNETVLSVADVHSIEQRMREYVKADLPFVRTQISRSDAAAYFRANGKEDKARLVESRREENISIYQAGCLRDTPFDKLAPSAGYLTQFRLLPYAPGFVVRLPIREYLGVYEHRDFIDKQLQTTLADYQEWSDLMGIRTASDLNDIVSAGTADFNDLVLIAETLQERNLHKVSDEIYTHFPEVQLVLLAGPSSSGKTTTTHRLAIQFRTIGVRPVIISLDDYFVDRNKTPLNEQGLPDYENISALNIEQFRANMNDLLAGREAELPLYDFKTGKNLPAQRKLRLEENQILLVEGIHALNETLTADIPAARKRKVFISALTQVNLDDVSPVSASDNRLMRRMVRDMQFRGATPEHTLEMWNDVRRGEHHNIFPFQQSANFFVNSALIYELSVLRPIVETALLTVSPDHSCYLEAQRLLRLIRCFDAAPADAVPRHSILQEFLGNSIF